MERELEELAREIVRVQKSEMSEPPLKAPIPAFTLTTLFEKGPAWIGLLVAAIVGYASLNTRVRIYYKVSGSFQVSIVQQ